MNFSFKCHRETPPSQTSITNVFSVNAISFHPTFGTFSTAGSDGTFHFWFVFSVASLPVCFLTRQFPGTRTPSTASKAILRLVEPFRRPPSTETARSLPTRSRTTGARAILETAPSTPTRSCCIPSRKMRQNRGLQQRSGRWQVGSEFFDHVIAFVLAFVFCCSSVCVCHE